MRKLTGLMVVLAVASVGSAAMSLEIVQTDNSSALPAGWVTNDLLLTTDTDWLSSELLVTLDTGEVYAAVGGTDVPNPALFAILPTTEYDSWMTCPDSGAVQGLGVPSFSGGAVDLGGAAELTFADSLVNVGWFGPGSDTDDIGELMLGRITLSNDASGSWSMWSGSQEQPNLIVGGPVEGGVMVVPEPMTMSLLVVGALGFLARKRR